MPIQNSSSQFVVRVVPLVPVKEVPRKVKPATPDLSQRHDPQLRNRAFDAHNLTDVVLQSMQLSYDYAKDRALMCLRANYESHLSMTGSMVVSLMLLGVVNAASTICRPKMAVMWYFQ